MTAAAKRMPPLTTLVLADSARAVPVIFGSARARTRALAGRRRGRNVVKGQRIAGSIVSVTQGVRKQNNKTSSFRSSLFPGAKIFLDVQISIEIIPSHRLWPDLDIPAVNNGLMRYLVHSYA